MPGMKIPSLSIYSDDGFNSGMMHDGALGYMPFLPSNLVQGYRFIEVFNGNENKKAGSFLTLPDVQLLIFTVFTNELSSFVIARCQLGRIYRNRTLLLHTSRAVPA